MQNSRVIDFNLCFARQDIYNPMQNSRVIEVYNPMQNKITSLFSICFASSGSNNPQAVNHLHRQQ